MRKPPPVLDYARVVHYVRIDRSVTYRGRTLLFVDGKELGRVPHLAICEGANSGFLLLHCNRNWKSLGGSAHVSVAAAKKKAEWIYPGLAKHWKASHVTKKQAREFLEEIWGKYFCGFCNRRSHQVERLFGKKSPYICGDCVTSFHARLQRTSEAAGQA